MADLPEHRSTSIIHSAGGVIVGHNGQIVLVRQPEYAVCWSLPKGKQQPHESLEQTARRKITEETGLTELKILKEFPPYERGRVKLPGEPATSEQKVLHFFLFKTDQTRLKPHSPSIGEARWVTNDEAIELLTHPKDQEFLTSAKLRV